MKKIKVVSLLPLVGLYVMGISLIAATMLPFAYAEDQIVPYNKNLPVDFPIVTTQNVPPLASEKPKDPVYIPQLEGLISGDRAIEFFGRKVPKYDALEIKKSVVKGGKVVIPPGGFVFKFDTLAGDLPMVGSEEFVFGKDNIYYYVDYPGAVIVKKTNVPLKVGKSIVVGDHILTFTSAVGHGRFLNLTISVRNKLGLDWDFVGMSPAVFSIGATPNDPGKDSFYGYPAGYKPGGPKEADYLDYIQLFANRKDISRKQIKFSTVYATDIQAWTMCKAPLAYKGRAGKGKKINVKGYTVEVVDTKRNKNLQTAKIRITAGGKTVAEKTLVWDKNDFYRSPYNVNWQKKVLLKHDDIIVQLLKSLYIKDAAVDKRGRANLVVYKDCMVVEDGKPSVWDQRFIVDQTVCPQGHGFGTIFYNKEEVVLTNDKNTFDGPRGYIKLVIDKIKGDTARFHLESGTGAKSLTFEKKGNVDLLFGKGRATKDIVHDVGHSTQDEMYRQMEKQRAVNQ